LTEALARVRNDSVVSRPARAPTAARGIVRRFGMRARALPARVYLGAAFSALLVGIGVNALMLQRARHPAPLFAPARPHASPTSAPLRVPDASHASPRATFAPAPAPPRTVTNDDAPSRAPDQIGDLLRDQNLDGGSRLILAAQGALQKIGYPVKIDGAEGAATQQALRDFERSHGLPLTTEITPGLVKQLTSAARAAGR
jgi:putative peptidoglycan binding protein